jgi:hypothetical protein
MRWIGRVLFLSFVVVLASVAVAGSATAGNQAAAGAPVVLNLKFRLVVGSTTGACDDWVFTSETYALFALPNPTHCPSRFLLIDDRTGSRRVIRMRGFTIADAFAAPLILFQQNGNFVLYNIDTGSLRPAQCSRGCGPGPFAYALGTRWVEFFVQQTGSCGDGVHNSCGPITHTFYNIQTGQSRFQASQSDTMVADLDSRSLFHRVCRPLQAAPTAPTGPTSELAALPPSLTFYGRFAIAINADRTAFLERCGSNLHMPIDQPTQSGPLGLIMASRRAVVWQTVDQNGLWHGQFAGVLLPSLRPFTAQLPASIPNPGFLLSVRDARDLYVLDGTGRVWRAAFAPR